MAPPRPPRRWSTPAFILVNAVIWLVMVVILVIVPDQLERWMSIGFARAIGWAVAGSVWVLVVEQEWQTRFGVWTRFALQLTLWVAAAVLATWISDQANVRVL